MKDTIMVRASEPARVRFISENGMHKGNWNAAMDASSWLKATLRTASPDWNVVPQFELNNGQLVTVRKKGSKK